MTARLLTIDASPGTTDARLQDQDDEIAAIVDPSFIAASEIAGAPECPQDRRELRDSPCHPEGRPAGEGSGTQRVVAGRAA